MLTPCSLAYMELRVIIARIIWNFDFELVNKEMDWFRDSRVFIMWDKPDLMLKICPRTVYSKR